MLLYAIGTVAGLAAAGYELLSARGTETRTVPAENVALVNQQPILRSDFIAQVESETGLPFEQTSRKDKLRVLDEMVDEELKVQRGLELNFPETDQDTRNALSNVVDQQMLVEVAVRQPTEQELMDYYDSHRAQYQTPGAMTVCDLVVAGGRQDAEQAGVQARRAVAALRSGNALPQVVQRYGLANKNECENNFYFAIQIHLGEPLFQAARLLATDTVSDPIRIGADTHILRMIRNTAPVAESYSDARNQVWDDYRSWREAQIRTGTMRFLRHRAHILIASDYSDYQVNAAAP